MQVKAGYDDNEDIWSCSWLMLNMMSEYLWRCINADYEGSLENVL